MWGGVGEVVRIYYTYRLVGVCVVGLPRRLGKSVPAAARPTLVAAGCGKPFAMPAAESVDRRLWYVLSCCARPLARGGQPTRPARESTGTNERRGSSAAAIHARWAETECLPAPPSRPCCLVHEAGCGQLAGQALGQRRSAAHVARVAHGLAPRSAGYRAAVPFLTGGLFLDPLPLFACSLRPAGFPQGRAECRGSKRKH